MTSTLLLSTLPLSSPHQLVAFQLSSKYLLVQHTQSKNNGKTLCQCYTRFKLSPITLQYHILIHIHIIAHYFGLFLYNPVFMSLIRIIITNLTSAASWISQPPLWLAINCDIYWHPIINSFSSNYTTTRDKFTNKNCS